MFEDVGVQEKPPQISCWDVSLAALFGFTEPEFQEQREIPSQGCINRSGLLRMAQVGKDKHLSL